MSIATAPGVPSLVAPDVTSLISPEVLSPASAGVAWVDPTLAPLLVGVIVLAVVATAVLFAVGVLAYARRRTPRYLLITIALGLLLTRSIVGLGTILGLVPMTVHHLVEHGVDVTIAALVLYAVYRSAPRTDVEAVGIEGT